VYHDGPAGTGVATGVGSVDTSARAWTSPTLDGQLYGEPLVFGNRVYVATENDVVYALSAATGKVVWSARLGTALYASTHLLCSDILPNVGITGTPVIDPARQEIFVVADVLVNGKAAHMLTGLNTATGQVELSQDVDPPNQAPPDLLQRTGLTLDDGHVYFGFGGNTEMCGTYHGRVVSVPEAGGTPNFFTTTLEPGDGRGSVWMGGGAPAVGPNGDLWVETGNSLEFSPKDPYDYSEAVLELSPSLHVVQFFTPADWASDNDNDLDMSAEPVLLPGGQVILAGKGQVIYLVNGKHLGGIGTQEAELGPVCSTNIDGGGAHVGMTAYLPCTSGVIAVKATLSPARLHLLWTAPVAGGPPIVAGGLVWTVGRNGNLYGLDPATGKVRQQAAVGTPANHFPTPGIGAGLMLVPGAQNVVAFRTSGAAAGQGTGAATSPPRANPSPGPAAAGGPLIAGVALGCLAAAGASGWFIWFIRRRRHT
jgi:outer membrane protein assembly factor BamB